MKRLRTLAAVVTTVAVLTVFAAPAVAAPDTGWTGPMIAAWLEAVWDALGAVSPGEVQGEETGPDSVFTALGDGMKPESKPRQVEIESSTPPHHTDEPDT